MFKQLMVALIIGVTNASKNGGLSLGLGSKAGLSSGLGGYGGLALGSGYGGGGALGLGLGNGLGITSNGGPVSAAIHSRRTYQVIPVPSRYEPAVPQVIDVEPTYQPVQIIFRSVSSPVMVKQIHSPGEPGRTEATRSEDQAHRVLHEVLRPVIQEVREVIQPYRRVTQEIKPVVEEVHTVVAKGERHEGSALVEGPIAGPAIIADVTGAGLDLGRVLGGGIGNGLGIGLKGGSALSFEDDLSYADGYSSGVGIGGKGLSGAYRSKAKAASKA